ncbi:Putative AC transposase [Linum grandiflorum]
MRESFHVIVVRRRNLIFLSWWKLNDPKYPTLQAIAKAVLAVPITSVASESAFSSGGRLLDPYRSRLHWNTVELLMCTRSWVQDGTKTAENEGETSALEGVFSILAVNDELVEADEEEDGKFNSLVFNFLWL